MRTTIAILSLALVLAAALHAEEASVKAPAASGDDISTWIKELSSDEYQTREEAEKKLQAVGDSVIPKLKEVAEKTEDAETRQRCERIVSNLTAGPRIAQALKDLESDDWEKAKKSIEILLDELGKKHGAEEALEKAAKENNPSGQMAQAIRAQLDNLKQQKEQYEKIAEERPEIAEQMRNTAKSIETWSRRNILQVCENLWRNTEHKKKPGK